MNLDFPSNLTFSPTLAEFHQYAIALHTASPDLGLALSNFGNTNRMQVWSGLGQATSAHLHSYLAEFIQPQTWKELGFIAVAQGPGGFTGTRLGIVTARTLAQQLQIPLFAVSTLAAYAWTAKPISPSKATEIAAQDIAVQMMAHRGELYTAIYRIEAQPVSREDRTRLPRLKPLRPDTVMSQATWQQVLATWAAPYHLIEVEAELGKTVGSVLELAYLNWLDGLRPHWSEALPFYGQSPV